MAGKKKISETKAVRIYGPYPDQRDPTKWTFHVLPPDSTKNIKVPTFGFDLAPLVEVLRPLLFTSMVNRAAGEDDE